MRKVFEALQMCGSIAMIISAGWFAGMLVGIGTEHGSIWLIVGPIVISSLVNTAGWVFEFFFNAGIKSATEMKGKESQP